MTRGRNVFEILSLLDLSSDPMTSSEIAEELNELGIMLTDRMIRNYLQELDGEGLTESVGKGRKITDRGRDELKTRYVYDRADFIIDKIVRVISDATFDINKRRGEVPITLSFIDESEEHNVRAILEELCQSSLFPQLVKIAHSGENICHRTVPKGKIGLAVIASVITDELFLKQGISSRPGSCCIIGSQKQRLVRCTLFDPAIGCSYDPIGLWINKKVVSVYDAVVKGKGEILAEYVEVPYTARSRTIRLLKNAVEVLGGTIVVGGSEDNVLGIPTKPGYTGVIVVTAESLPAALEEQGIKTNTETIVSAINLRELEPIAPVRGEVILL